LVVRPGESPRGVTKFNQPPSVNLAIEDINMVSIDHPITLLFTIPNQIKAIISFFSFSLLHLTLYFKSTKPTWFEPISFGGIGSSR
jgi:hypothetical protein